jgi:hypothetical protein
MRTGSFVGKYRRAVKHLEHLRRWPGADPAEKAEVAAKVDQFWAAMREPERQEAREWLAEWFFGRAEPATNGEAP